MPLSPTIPVAAVILRDEAGQILTVRKRGTERFMAPGGKPESGETFADAAIRECREELGVELRADDLRLVGVFTAAAANEPDFLCEQTLFEHPVVTNPTPHAEIDAVRWLDPARPLAADDAPLLHLVVPQMGGRRSLRRVTVYCGSSPGDDPGYARAAAEIGAELGLRGLEIVYGGGHVGLMGAVADAALAVGAPVTGVIPVALKAAELAHPGLTRLEVVEDMAARKARMFALGDAFVALPGGPGTLEEFFEVWTWQQLGLHARPVALYNAGGYWDPLITAIHHMVTAGFLARPLADALVVADTPGVLLEALTTWQPPVIKWRHGTQAFG